MKHESIFEKVMPYITVGIFIALAIVGIILLSYLLIWGAIIGLVIYAIAYVKERFFPSKKPVKHEQKGRTIDHDDL